MIPTRPLKTFNNWLQHQVVTKSHDGFDLIKKITSGGYFHLRRNCLPVDPDRVGSPGYFESRFLFSVYPGDTICKLYFGSQEDANLAISRIGGEYDFVEIGQSPIYNSPLRGNLTLVDLMKIYGDPLPLKIKILLLEQHRKGGDYFGIYEFLHHPHKKMDWWPEYFIYRTGEREEFEDDLDFLHGSSIDVKDVHIFRCGFEFRKSEDAMMFKLVRGESLIHPLLEEKTNESWDSYVNNLSPVDRGYLAPL